MGLVTLYAGIEVEVVILYAQSAPHIVHTSVSGHSVCRH